MIHVTNMESPRSRRPVANQVIIHDESNDRDIFQSYETIVAIRDYRNGVVVLDRNALDYSQTTSRYLYQFLGMDRRDIQERIALGILTVADLNDRTYF